MKPKLLIKPKLIILVGMLLSIFTANSYKVIGYLGSFTILAGALVSTRRMYADRIFKVAIFCMAVMFCRLIVQLTTNTWYAGTLRSFMLQMMVLLSIILFRNSELKLDEWEWIFIRFDLYIVILGTLLFLTHGLVKSSCFSTMFGNYLLIAFGMTMILYQLYDAKRDRITLGVIMLLLIVYTYLSEMRSAAVGELVGFSYMAYTSARHEGRVSNSITFILLMVLCFSVPYLYMELYNPSSDVTRELAIWLQQKVLVISRSRLFSGRNTIWLHILPAVKESLIFGRGFGFTPSLVYDTSLSAHNLFLFIRMEQGYVGLLAFMLLLFEIWVKYYRQKRNNTKFAAQGFMVAVLIQQTFSLGLVGGKGAFSIICWCVLIALTKREEIDQHEPQQEPGA